MTGNRCVIYTRVSSDHQETEGTSLVTQLERCREYATRNGYSVVGEYQDTFTGAKLRERPSMRELLAYVRTDQVNVVLAYSLDRLSRKQVHVAVIDEECQRHGARLEFVTEAFEQNATGQFIRAATAFAGELERERLAERTVRGRYERARRGKRIPTKKPCYGFVWSDPEKNSVVVQPDEADIVVRIHMEVSRGRSLYSVAQGLQEDGIPSPTGQLHWSSNTLRNIIRTPDYAGKGYAWGRADIIERGDYSKAIPLPEGSTPRLVSDDIKAACLSVLARNQQESSRNSRHPEMALLRTPFAICGVCGGTMTINKRLYTYKTKREYHYEYRCETHCRKHECPTYTSMRVETLDSAVWPGIIRVLTEPNLVQSYIEMQRTTDPVATSLETVEQQLRETERKLRNLAESISTQDDRIVRNTLMEAMGNCAKRAEKLGAELAALLTQQQEWQAKQATFDTVEAMCQYVTADFEKLTYTQKRDVLRALQVKVRVWSKKFPIRFDVDLSFTYDLTGNGRGTQDALLQILTGKPLTVQITPFSYLKPKAEQEFCGTAHSITKSPSCRPTATQPPTTDTHR